MLIGIDANEANVANRVGSNKFACQVLKQLYSQDKHNNYRIYLKNKPVKDLPYENSKWQYSVLQPTKLWTQWRLPLDLYFTKPRPDIFLTLGHYAPRFSPISTIITIMDLAFLKFPQHFLKKDLHKLKNWTKYSAKNAKHIFTISQHSKQDIIKHYQIPAQKITVTYPAIDHQGFPAKTSAKKYKNYLLYLGTLQPRKNLLNLIKAYSQLPQQYSKLKLVIAGKKGWLYQELFQQIKDLNLQNKVIFTGFVPEPDIPSLIKNAQLLILPSFYEGFGIPVLQSMSVGTLVLVSKNSSLKEIVKNTGIYIQPPFAVKETRQGIIKALSLSEVKKQQLIKQAKQRARQFNWQKTGQKILEVIHGLNL